VTLLFCCREKEEPVPANVTMKNKPTSNKSFSTSSIPKEITVVVQLVSKILIAMIMGILSFFLNVSMIFMHTYDSWR